MELTLASAPSVAVVFAAARAVTWVVLIAAILPRLVVPPGRVGTRVTWCVLVVGVDVAVWASGIPDALAVVIALGFLALLLGGGRPGVALHGMARRSLIWAVNRVRSGTELVPLVGVTSDRPPSGGHAGLLATFAAWWRILGAFWGRLVRMWRREDLGALSRIALVGVGVSLWRMLRDRPLAAGEASQILAREGWVSRSDSWVTDLALGDLARRLLGTSPAVAAVACTAPIVFVASWSGLAALRRYSPVGAAWPGAIAGAAVPVIEVVSGAPASPTLAAGPLLGWGIAAAFGGAPESLWAWPIGMTLLHPFAGVAASLILIAAVLHAPPASGAARDRRRAVVALASTLVAITGAWLLHARAANVSGVAPLLLGAPFYAVAGAAALAIIVVADRAIEPAARARTRALGVATLLALVVSAIFPTAFDVDVAASLGLLTLAAVVATRVRLPSTPAGLAAASLCLVASWILGRTAPQRPPAPVTRDAVAIELALRERHLRREFTVVGPRDVLAAFAGEGWFIAEQDVPARFAPESYRFSRAHPEWIIQTEHTYVLTSDEGTSALAPWLDALARGGVQTPTVEALGRGSWRVRDLVRPTPDDEPLVGRTLR